MQSLSFKATQEVLNQFIQLQLIWWEYSENSLPKIYSNKG